MAGVGRTGPERIRASTGTDPRDGDFTAPRIGCPLGRAQVGAFPVIEVVGATTAR